MLAWLTIGPLLPVSFYLMSIVLRMWGLLVIVTSKSFLVYDVVV